MKELKVVILVLLITVSGCDCNKTKTQANLSGIEVNLEIKRLDRDIFQLKPDSMSFVTLDSAYNGFLSFYVSQILALGDFEKQPQQTLTKLSEYLSNPYIIEVRDSCEKTFKDFTTQKKELEQALRYFKYHFPKKPVPNVVTFISNFGYSAITYDTVFIGLGLDMHHGKDFKYYPDLFPQYMYEKFSPEYITANSMKALASLHFQIAPKDGKLLSRMVSNGIGLYFTDLTMPDDDDYKKIGYKPEDIQWCRMNETEIWKFLIERDLLYSTDTEMQKRYVEPGPSSSGMPKEAPGNVGTWVGWQIVRAYVKKYPQTTFEELLNTEPQELLTKSGYKPG